MSQDISPEDDIPAAIKKLSFEQALAALEKIVDELEAGDVALEASIEIYRRGSHLRAVCMQKLQIAQAKIEKITLDADQNPTGCVPLDTD